MVNGPWSVGRSLQHELIWSGFESSRLSINCNEYAFFYWSSAGVLTPLPHHQFPAGSDVSPLNPELSNQQSKTPFRITLTCPANQMKLSKILLPSALKTVPKNASDFLTYHPI